jgi:hypothetical protein
VTGIYVPWLADAARLTGYPVVEIAGWRTRGHGGMSSVEGVVLHHTAGPKQGEYPSLAVVRDGRAGLPGPLANYGLGRSGTVYVNAAGLAYHAGASQWQGDDPDGRPFTFQNLNARFLGIEAEDDGDGTWTLEQRDCYPRLAAALCYFMRRPAARVCGHRECAMPLGRKPDPTGIDLPALRSTVASYLADPLRLIPRGGTPPAPPAPARHAPEDDVMYIRCQLNPSGPESIALLTGAMFVGLGSPKEIEDARRAMDAGAPFQWVERFTWQEFDKRSHALCDNPRPVLPSLPQPAATPAAAPTSK